MPHAFILIPLTCYFLLLQGLACIPTTKKKWLKNDVWPISNNGIVQTVVEIKKPLLAGGEIKALASNQWWSISNSEGQHLMENCSYPRGIKRPSVMSVVGIPFSPNSPTKTLFW